ncbi:MAG: hypothetical protein MJ246_06485 [Clostridia bacterium]|nr:hypothetical protein [Clostridia bacterium]
MKKFLCYLITATLVCTMLMGCGKESAYETTNAPSIATETKEETPLAINKATASIPLGEACMENLNATTGMAVSSYIVSRAYLDKICEYDIENGSEEELKELIIEAMKAFDAADKLSANMENIATINEGIVKDPVNKGKYQEAKALIEKTKFSNPFILTVYADEKSEALSEAQRIVEMYDKAPQLKGIQTLATQLNTDTKHAYAKLKQALAIMEGQEYSDLAEKENAAVNTCLALKTAGTAAGLVVSVSTAGASTSVLGAVMEGGGIVCSGINTMCEVAINGSTIITGNEKNVVARAYGKVENFIAPVSEITGIYGFATSNFNYKTMKAADLFNIVSFGGGELVSACNDGTILGGLINFNKEEETMDVTFVDTKASENAEENAKNFEEIAKEINIPTAIANEAAEAIKIGNLEEEAKSLFDDTIKANASCDPNSDEYVCDEVMEDIVIEITNIAEEENVDISEYEFMEAEWEDIDIAEDQEGDYTEVDEDNPNPFDGSDVEIVDEVDEPDVSEPEVSAEEDVVDENPNGIPTLDEILGNYDYNGVDFNGDPLHYSAAHFTRNGNMLHIVDTMLEGDFDMPYDESTGRAFISEDGASATYTFWKENGTIKSKLVMDFGSLGTFTFYATKK